MTILGINEVEDIAESGISLESLMVELELKV